jgi:glycosyltransferase involved in cell wall biosynthesis
MSHPRIALVRGPGLSVFELQNYEPLLDRYDLKAFGLAQHSLATDTLKIPIEKLQWRDSISGRSAMNAYRSRVKGERYFMPGLEKKLADYDLIHSAEITSTFSWQCARHKKKSRVPLVITSTENIRYPAWNDRTRLKLKKGILAAADFFFALTPDARDVLVSDGVEPARVAIVPFGVDLTRLRPGPRDPAWMKRFDIGDDDFVVLFAGRFVWEKGIYDLAAAARQLSPRNLRVLFVGGGAEQRNLESFIKSVGLSDCADCFTAIPYGQMINLYRLANVVVLPSLPTPGLREQYGMTLVEAMACGKPVVATRCGSMPWVIGDAGLLADPGNSSSLAECLTKLRESEQLRTELGGRGRRLAEERYDRARVATLIDAAYRSLLA